MKVSCVEALYRSGSSLGCYGFIFGRMSIISPRSGKFEGFHCKFENIEMKL